MSTPPTDDKTYHHGDLRRALLAAAEAELAEGGLEGFSLRKVARRAGVSHAAPAHHFGDAQGLLTALATEGFRRFAEALKDGAAAGADPQARLVGMGLGYVRFATGQRALFRLLFGSDRPDSADPELADAAEASFRVLADGVAAHLGAHPFQDECAMDLAGALWATAHGAADLVASGRMGFVGTLPAAARDAALRRMLARVLDGGG